MTGQVIMIASLTSVLLIVVALVMAFDPQARSAQHRKTPRDD